MSGFRLFLVALFLLPALSRAGSFSVSPLRLDLSSEAKAGSFVISNDGASLKFKTSLMRWTQDEQGVDHYEASSDLVYFPRSGEVATGGTRVVRAALNVEQGAVEQAYRLYVEELPDETPAASKGATVSVLIRFGVPVYIAPLTPVTGLALETRADAGGAAQLVLRNTGNVHLYLRALSAPGQDFSGFKARYLLPGAAIALGPVRCAGGDVPVTVDTEQGAMPVVLHGGACLR